MCSATVLARVALLASGIVDERSVVLVIDSQYYPPLVGVEPGLVMGRSGLDTLLSFEESRECFSLIALL